MSGHRTTNLLELRALHQSIIWAQDKQIGLVLQSLIFGLSRSLGPWPGNVRLYSF
jgi:hypothetical protein